MPWLWEDKIPIAPGEYAVQWCLRLIPGGPKSVAGTPQGSSGGGLVCVLGAVCGWGFTLPHHRSRLFCFSLSCILGFCVRFHPKKGLHCFVLFFSSLKTIDLIFSTEFMQNGFL